MYTLNKLQRNVLITYEEVLFHAPTKHTLDARQVEQSIIVAEERFIRSELGYDLYDAMAASKNVVVTAGNIVALQLAFTNQGSNVTLVEGMIVNAYEQMSPAYQSLWKQHVWKLDAECVMLSAFPEGFIQFGSEGTFHTVPPAGLMVTSGLVTPLLPSVKWAMDKKIQDRIHPLVESMHNYLCKNKTSYSLYKKTCPECDETGEAKARKWTGLALGIYDDIDNVGEDCCGNGQWGDDD
jgi:hypothetical protein